MTNVHGLVRKSIHIFTEGQVFRYGIRQQILKGLPPVLISVSLKKGR